VEGEIKGSRIMLKKRVKGNYEEGVLLRNPMNSVDKDPKLIRTSHGTGEELLTWSSFKKGR